MSVDLNALKNHPGKNPEYEKLLANRISIMNMNREAGMKLAPIPKMPNKYVPHYGAKEQKKYEDRLK